MTASITYQHDSQSIVISIPDQLYWIDEYKWSKKIQTQEYAISGSLIVEEWVKLAGRPITLQGGEDRVWVDKNTVIQIQTLVDLPGKEITLMIRGWKSFQCNLRQLFWCRF